MRHTILTYDMNSISQHGFLVERFEKRSQSAEDILMDKGIHQDSYYIFTCLEKGHANFLKEEKEAVYNNDADFYLTGDGSKMPLSRKFLKARGVDPKCIRSQAYWIEGKKGL